jgi:hypothetical protein
MNANDANTTNIRNIDISLLSWLLVLLSVVCCPLSYLCVLSVSVVIEYATPTALR